MGLLRNAFFFLVAVVFGSIVYMFIYVNHSHYSDPHQDDHGYNILRVADFISKSDHLGIDAAFFFYELAARHGNPIAQEKLRELWATTSQSHYHGHYATNESWP